MRRSLAPCVIKRILDESPRSTIPKEISSCLRRRRRCACGTGLGTCHKLHLTAHVRCHYHALVGRDVCLPVARYSHVSEANGRAKEIKNRTGTPAGEQSGMPEEDTQLEALDSSYRRAFPSRGLVKQWQAAPLQNRRSSCLDICRRAACAFSREKTERTQISVRGLHQGTQRLFSALASFAHTHSR